MRAARKNSTSACGSVPEEADFGNERDRIVGMNTRAILLVAAASLLAQDATIRVEVQQVLVPVVVTDQKGHHVSGLRAADFRISEDGVPQEIAAFSSDKAGSVDRSWWRFRGPRGSPGRGTRS